MRRTLVVLVFALLVAPAAAQVSAAPNGRLSVFDAAQKFCISKLLSSSVLTANVIGSGNWSISHVCECASALTVSKMTDQEVNQAASPESLADFNLKLSTNMSTCVHIQP